MPMTKIDRYETELLAAIDKGALKSVATKAELSKFRAAARATAIKDRRVNIRLSSGNLQRHPGQGAGRRFAVPDAHCARSAQVRHRAACRAQGAEQRRRCCGAQSATAP
jgi:hypothetical protein